MRWTFELSSAEVVAFPQEQERRDDVFSAAAPAQISLADESGRKALIGIFSDATTTDFFAWVENPSGGGFRPPHPEWWFRDHFVVFLNPGHDHASRLMYAATYDGRLVREAAWTVPGEEPGDLMSGKLETPAEAEAEFRRIDERRFAFRLRLPTKVCFPCFPDDEATPTGLALKIGFLEECLPEALSWPPVCPWAKDQPLIFNDLRRVTPRLSVESSELREPTWGGKPSLLRLRGRLRQCSADRGRVRVRLVLPGDSEQEQTPAAWQADEGVFSADVPIVFPFRAKWANGLHRMARLLLTMEDEAGSPLWKAQYPFGFDGGIIVRERFGTADAELPPRPKPTDPAFLDRFREYVLARLPAYRARTTAAGAPSDFFLEDPAGKDSLNLSAADALARVAEMISREFPFWEDALCAAAMWVHHPLVTRHSASWSRISGQVAVAAIPKLGGCFCGDTAGLTAVLAEKIGARLGVALRGYSLGLRGHLATLVETPKGRVVIDGMLGLWFHTLDNARLATLEEMRACREIAERVWYAPRAHGHEFFHEVYDQIIRPWADGPLAYPPAT